MPSRDQLYQALQRADAAGDTEAARAIARRLAQTPAVEAPPEPSAGELATEGMGTYDKIMAGIGRGATDVGQAIKQLGNAAQTVPIPMAGFGGLNALDPRLQEAMQKRNAQYNQEVASENQLFDEGLGQTSEGFAGRIGGNIAATAPLALVGGVPATLGQMVRTGAVQGALGGALTPVTTGEADIGADKALQVGGGAAAGAILGSILRGGQVTVGKVRELAGKLKDAMPGVTKAARERAAAEMLRNFAADPANLAKAGANAQLVKGTQQTLAEATDDAGIAGLQQTLGSMSRDFANRNSALQQSNNAARVKAIQDAFGGASEGAAEAIESQRDKVTAPLLAAARKVKGVDTKPVLGLIDRIAKDRQGRPAVVNAVTKVKDLLSQEGMDDVQRLHNVRQAIGDMLSGSSPDSDSARAAARELMTIKRSLDAQIGKASPEFRQFLTQYADMSRNAGQVRLGDELLGKSKASLDAANNPVLSPAQFARAADNMDRVARQATGFRRETAERLMTPEQRSTVGAVRSDLDRLARSQTAGRPPGSSTAQNLAGIGRVQDELGGSEVAGAFMPASLRGPMAIFNSVRNRYGQKILDTVQDALLNPKEAQRILASLPVSQRAQAQRLARDPRITKAFRTIASAYSGQAAASATDRERRPSESRR